MDSGHAIRQRASELDEESVPELVLCRDEANECESDDLHLVFLTLKRLSGRPWIAD